MNTYGRKKELISRRSPLTRVAVVVAALAVVGALAGCSAGAKPDANPGKTSHLEKSNLSIALTGVGTVSNVPLYLAEKLGYFKDEGLTVKLTALKGGTDAIQSLVTNTVDATTNEYVHTISVQQQSKFIEAVMVFQNAPTYAMVVTKAHAGATIKDLANLNIGVVSLGGSTEDLVNYLFETNGMNPDKAKLVATGAGASQSAAVQSGAVAALIATEPTLTTSLQSGAVKTLVDFRKPEVIKKMFGGPAPFWSVLVTNEFAKQNPNTTQALVTACLKALKFMHANSAQKITDQLPGEVFYPSGDKTTFVHILEGALDGFSKDGLMPDGGPSNILKYLQKSEPGSDVSSIKLDQTYDDSFARKAAQ